MPQEREKGLSTQLPTLPLEPVQLEPRGEPFTPPSGELNKGGLLGEGGGRRVEKEKEKRDREKKRERERERERERKREALGKAALQAWARGKLHAISGDLQDAQALA